MFKYWFFGFVFIFVGVVGGYAYLEYHIKHDGIIIHPDGIHPSKSLQADYVILNSNIVSSSIINREVIPLCLNYVFKINGSGYSTPVLIHKLDSAGAYKSMDKFNWKAIEKAFPGYANFYKRIFGSDDINNELIKGRLPIVEVVLPGTEIHSWIVITGSTTEDYLIYDPLNSKRKYLTDFGKLYAFKVLYKTSYRKIGL